MNTKSISILFASGLAAGLLSSCVTPYDHHRGAVSVTTSSYEPGYQLSSLPRGYRREVIGNNDYYYHNGAYFRRHTTGYVVVEAPRTSRYYTEYNRYRVRDTRAYPQPSGYRVINDSGRGYYRSGDRDYFRQGPRYDAVGRPY